ncbi:hypothetical protein [Salmonella phage NINP13076]|uniref:Nucleoside triphosphate pyrophosphohydrolase n=1 Tax=Salmonella phage SalP219 TaxID=3158864 RepID=A0AAU7PIH8_9CAUD|nr:hypothetical protein [Salmonella phage NINP13076]
MTGITERVLQSSVRAQARSAPSVMMNLVEEVGELARALNRPHRCDEPAIAEIADVINCAIDLAFMLEISECINPRESDYKVIAETVQRRIEYFVDKKCDKWDKIVQKMGRSKDGEPGESI